MITKDMRIVDVLQAKPESARVFSGYGMGCIHCLLAHQETVEQAAMVHGIDLDTLLAQLNEAQNAKQNGWTVPTVFFCCKTVCFATCAPKVFDIVEFCAMLLLNVCAC